MVAPAKRPFPAPPANAAEPNYHPVPTDRISPPDPSSPNLHDPYANLGGSLPDSAYLSPDAVNAALLGRQDPAYLPAPSIMSRESTYNSLPGTPPLQNNRDSWGSATALPGAAAGISGAANRGRGQSNLAHSTLGWNNTSDDRMSYDDDDGQGHVTPAAAGAGLAGFPEKSHWDAGHGAKKSRKWLWLGLGVGALVILAGAGIGLGIGLTQNKNKSNATGGSSGDKPGLSSSSRASGTGTATTSGATPSATTGGQGSLLTFEDGSTMIYQNTFGGKWVWDPANPFNNDAQANSWTPSLSQNWTWGVDKIYGVNLGGWLVTEPFIVPALYEKYATGPGGTAVDEYTLSLNMGNNLTAAMTEHYETFITERDIAEIAQAGLNWVRLPIGHWAIETNSEESYLERISWTYFLKVVQWCRKYGIRINLDLHTVPGSQNGWNHSGHLGSINWMNGAMGLANAQRALDYIRTLAQFISQPEYAPVVQLFGFINEPNGLSLNKQIVGSFYLEAYKVIREVTGIGQGNGPMLSMHDGFLGPAAWPGFAVGSDRMALDQHPYMDQQVGSIDTIEKIPCQWWGAATNTTSQQFGANVAGEYSAAINDCGKWVNDVGVGSRFDGTMAGYTGPNGGAGACDYWNDYTQWNASTIAGLLHVTRASMDALQNSFFWTWRIGNSTVAVPAEVNPFWHYRLGLANGWVPTDPRSSVGMCAADGVSGNDFEGTFSSAYMTGGPGAGTLASGQTASYPWPPQSFTNVASASISLLPQYTETATPITMPGPTFTSPGSSATIKAGNGWANANDNQRLAFAPVAGCSYPPEYSAATIAATAGACGAGLSQPLRRAAMPAPTAPPS